MQKKSYLPILLVQTLFVCAAALAQTPSLARTSFRPGDPAFTLLTMSEAGRVSVRALSSSGVAISLHDRMEGELARSGSEGQQDGRIDITLDKGEYKVRVEGKETVENESSISAKAFLELNGDKSSAWPILLPGAVLEAKLLDLQSASYWVELREDGPIEVEALGRDLAALEIWRDGQYLVESYAPREERSIERGRPMGWICASRQAQAGRYLVRVYGGASRVWSNEAPKHPLLLRAGFIPLPIGGRLSLAISPFGRDFVLAEGVDRAVMTRVAKGEGALAAQAYAPGSDRLSASGRAVLTKASATLSCVVRVPSDGPALIALEGAPGDAVYLDANASREESLFTAQELKQGGLLTVSSPRSSAPQLEASGIAYRLAKSASGDRAVLAKDFCVPLSSSASIRRRCNLGSGGELSMYVRVEDAGSYRIAEKAGTGQGSAAYRMELLDAGLRAAGRSQPATAAKSALELTQGYYRFSLSATSLGVLDFFVYKYSFARNVKAELDKDPPLVRASYSWAFDPDPAATDLRVILALGPSAGAGIDFSPFPLELERGIGIELGPKEELSLPFASATPARIRALAGGGTAIAVDGQIAADGAALAPGKRKLSLRNPTAGTAVLSFTLEPSYQDLAPPAIAAFGQGMEALSESSTVWHDFERQESTVYALKVDAPAVYAIESEGRLSTSILVRTPSRTKLFEATKNGYGRNASIRAWLRPGLYYVEVATVGDSRGRAALRMASVPLLSQTTLALGSVDRRTVPADAAVRFDIDLAQGGAIDFYSVGLSQAFPIRLEDADGFIVYSGSGKGELNLAKGRYSLYSLPVSIETNRLTWIAQVAAPPPQAPIAGIRRLGINERIDAVWNDDPKGDRYSFSLPADLPKVELRLPEEFSAALSGPGGDRELAPATRSGLALQRGSYVLTVRPRDKANRLPYSIGLATEVLAPGIPLRILVRDGERVQVSVPEDGFYELWSLGQVDIAARLVSEASGEPVASADDNGPDWNIDIVQRLKAGLYRLELRSISGPGEGVALSLVSRNAKVLPPASSAFESKVAIDASGVLLPFDTKSEEGLFLISSDAGAALSFRLYRGEALLAAGEGRIAVPLRKATQYSIYTWSPLGLSPTLRVKRLDDSPQSLSKPFSLRAGSVVKLQNSAYLSARVSEGSLLVSAGLELPCVDPGSSPFSTLPAGGWAWAPNSAAKVEPLALAEGEGAVLSLAAADQGFTTVSPDKAILIAADTGGQFRCGISALSAAKAGPAPYDWDASAAWSKGSVALLPPGDWKAKVWDGERSPGKTRRIGVGSDFYEIETRPALAMGNRETLGLLPGKAVALDLPDCTLSVLLGQGLVISAWKDGKALATRTALDGRASEVLSVPACRLLLANRGAKEASVRLAVLPSRSLADEELSAAKPYEAVDATSGVVRLNVKAGPQELLCLGGDLSEALLETSDGRYLRLSHDPKDGLFSSMAASTGSIVLRGSGGILRSWLAKSGKEIEGLVAQDLGAARRELKGATLLSGKGEAFRFVMQSSGYVDISCPGPGLLALSGAITRAGAAANPDPKVRISGSRDDMHLFAWLPAGDYGLWRRPALGTAAGGILRLDRIESRKADATSLAEKAFIAAGEYQAWSFAVVAKGLVGVGVRADADGLRGFLYDSRQGLVAAGPLVFAQLDPGEYLFVVKGLDSAPMEYSLALEGAEGSRLGVPPDILDTFKARAVGASSVAVPLRVHKLPVSGSLGQPSVSAEGDDDSADNADGGE